MTAGSSAPALLPACKHCGKFHPPGTLKCPHTDMILELVGRLLDGRFRLIERLGSGGMAEVWLAHNEMVDRRVAIKLLRPEVTRNEEAVERFKIEARAAGRIGSPHVCEIMDFGSSSIGPYIVMEWLKGRDLAQWIESDGCLEVEDAVWVVRQALLGLIDAHAAGVLHRDLKPGNIFVHELENGDAVVKLMDFGVSKLLDDRGRELTSAGMMLGTPEYMAPEQLMAAADIDERADIWAIGAILYRALSGERVFSGPNLAAVCHSVANEPIVPINERAPNLPPALVEIIHRCLDRNIEGRFAKAKDLAESLEPFDRVAFQVPLQLVDPRMGNAVGQRIANRIESKPSQIRVKRFIRDLGFAVVGLSVVGVTYFVLANNETRIGVGTTLGSTIEQLLASSPLSADRADVDDSDSNLNHASLSRTSIQEVEPTKPPTLPLPPPPSLNRIRDSINSSIVGFGTGAATILQTANDSSTGAVGLTETGGGAREFEAGTETGIGPGMESGLDSQTGAELVRINGLDAESKQTSKDDLVVQATSKGTQTTKGPHNAATPEKKGRAQSSKSVKSASTSESPPGTVEVDGLLGLLDRAPAMGQQEAKRYCLGLGTAGHLGIYNWRLPRPDEFERFVGNSLIRRGRYWSSAMWRGRSRVISLPTGREQSVKITRRLIRPFCVAPR